MHRVCQFAILAVGLLACSSCAGLAAEKRTVDWPERLARLDPAFGARFAVRAWVDRTHRLTWRGDPELRQPAIDARFATLDQQAAELCRIHLTRASAEAAIAFLRTDAGQAMVEAELLAMATVARHCDELPADLASWLSAPDQVGQHALTEFRAVEERYWSSDRPGIPSPVWLSFRSAAQIVKEPESESIGVFLGTEAGIEWLAGRTAAWPDARAAGQHAIGELFDAGYLADLLPLEELVLPRAEFPAEGTGTDADEVR